MTSNDTAASPTNIKRFLVKHNWKDYQVILEVDMDILTEETATLINAFWTGAEDRLDECGNDVRTTVIRMFGQNAICAILENGGLFSRDDCLVRGLSMELRGEEGWGGEGLTPGAFGVCGIRVVYADVEMPRFDDLELSEIQS